MKNKISFYTLGCKLNQSETAVLVDQFNQEGYEILPFGEAVDICVINTCTVTEKTDTRCRQMIRRAKKINPEARIAVVGCYAQLFSDKVREIDGVNFILGSDSKFDLLDLLNQHSNLDAPLIEFSSNNEFKNPQPGKFIDHTRAFAKIQDGCNNFCSYCAVPLARGNSRSDSLENVVETVKQLVARGHKEIVLTGVHIGMYGKDLLPTKTLLDMLETIEEIPGLERIRLSSLEPTEVENELLDFIVNSNKICHHFHIPLQNGDNEILKRMRRNYNVEYFEKVIKKVKNKLPNSGLGTDVIVGFPGETDVNFQNTIKLVERFPFSYLHVFSYSKRPGTQAAEFENHVNPKVIKERSVILRDIAKRKKREFYLAQVKQSLRVLWEEKSKHNHMYGWADNYVRVRAPFQKELLNSTNKVQIVHAESEYVDGLILS
jgi:threonylcarbamoyladenosine tRNA methylthiotransferase MtaB